MPLAWVLPTLAHLTMLFILELAYTADQASRHAEPPTCLCHDVPARTPRSKNKQGGQNYAGFKLGWHMSPDISPERLVPPPSLRTGDA